MTTTNDVLEQRLGAVEGKLSNIVGQVSQIEETVRGAEQGQHHCVYQL